ncbi:MAG: hypothetical protein JXA54_14065 [Candidatus Heimdallarchaeota archaeon]|nr:hypothetical protein [Candidatus Heimdallarchaeota archaeon]
MFTKDSKIKEEDLVLMETKTMEEKCGKCGQSLLLKIYYSRKGYQQKIECENCKLVVWKTPLE